MLATTDMGWARGLAERMSPIEDIRLVRILGPEDLAGFLASRERAVMLLDISSPALLEGWLSMQGSLPPVVAFADRTETPLVRAAMKMGAVDFLGKDCSLRDVSEAIYHASSRLEASPELKAQPGDVHGKLVTVASLRGGSGRSTVACNLALALGRRSAKPAALWDLNFSLGMVDVLLDVVAPRPFSDLVAQLGQMDPELFSTFFARHRSGTFVLPAPRATGSQMVELTPTHLQALITAARATFPLTVVDTSATFSELDFLAVQSADLVLLTITPDLGSIRAAVAYLDLIAANHVVKSKNVVVLNAWTRGELSRRHVQETLSLPIWGEVPYERTLFNRAFNTAEPVVLGRPGSRSGKAFFRLADRILSMRSS